MSNIKPKFTVATENSHEKKASFFKKGEIYTGQLVKSYLKVKPTLPYMKKAGF